MTLSAVLPRDGARLVSHQVDNARTRIGLRASASPTRATRSLGVQLARLIEADLSRWKRVIGGGLRSPTDGRQATEVAVAANALNRMLELGRPGYVRIA